MLWLKIIYALIMLATGVYLHLANPDMTETRLLINYWYVWLVLVVFAIIIVGTNKENE